MKKKINNLYKALGFVAIVGLLIVSAPPIWNTQAAALTALSDTMSSQKINEASSHVIRFTTPSGVATGDTVIVTFPSDFDFTSKTIGTLTLSSGATTGAETSHTLAASATASDWGAVFSGTEQRVLTLTAPSSGTPVTAGHKVILTYNSTNSLNASSANQYAVEITGSFGDTGSISVPILADDQVVVSAEVAQSITFTISDNTIGFGTLTSANARYATGDTTGDTSPQTAHTLVAGTNAASGYSISMAGTTLTSGGETITAIGDTNTASSAGSKQFGVRFDESGGSGVVSAPYAAAGFAFDSAAFPDEIATSPSATANTTYNAQYLANITANTAAGNYAATLTYTATANY